MYDLARDTAYSLHINQEQALVRMVSLFEQFVHCWALNMCLAKLEAGETLSKRESELLAEMCPFAAKPLPNIKNVIKSFEAVQVALLKTPHRVRDPITRELLQGESSAELSAYAAILFWRDYRNLCIHQGGFVTQRFYALHSEFFAASVYPFTHLKLEVRKPLQIDDEIFNAISSAQYRAVGVMNATLEIISGGRRGHPEAPLPRTVARWDFEPRSNALIMDGDHELSRAWLDATGQREMARERGWRLDGLYQPYRY